MKRRLSKQRFWSRSGWMFFIGWVALAWFAQFQPAMAQRSVKAGDLRVVLPPGQVARPSGTQVVRMEAKKGLPVYYGDVLETGVGGRLRARLQDGSILALGAQSRLEVVEHDPQTQQSTLQLQYGKVRAQVVQLSRPGSRFEVRTNTAVAGVLGTDEVIDAFSPVATLVLCIDGLVSVSNSDPAVAGTVTLNPGEVTIVQQGLPPEAPRPATANELEDALEGTAGAAPQVVADIGTGFVTAGEELVLNAADSFATGTITGYQWTLTNIASNAAVYNQTNPYPRLALDTTTWQPGNYNGTLTITTSTNQTGSANFGFVVIPSAARTTNPDELVRQLQRAYETLQPSEFMKLFDPLKYTGYAALQEAVEASFRNIAQIRVYVRRASGQIYEQGKVAIYQVDFEIRFSTKSEPDRVFTVQEQATLRLESGSGWLISDVPQGRLGSPGGLVSVPGTNNPTQVNSASTSVTSTATTVHIQPTAGGGPVIVPVGGTGESFNLENQSASTLTIAFSLPPEVTLTGGGQTGSSFVVSPGQTLPLTFQAGPGASTGTVAVQTQVASGNTTLPGPAIPLTVFRLTFTASTPSPLILLPNGSGTVSFQVGIEPPSAGPVQVSAPGGAGGISFSPASLSLNASGTASFAVNAGAAALAPTGFTFTATASGQSQTQTVSIGVQQPQLTFTATTPSPLILLPNGSGTVSFQVGIEPPSAGPVQVSAPGGAGGISFSPASLSLNASGTASFTVNAGAAALAPTGFTFTATASGQSQTQTVSIGVQQPLQFSLSGGSLTLAPGQSGQAGLQVGFISGTPQAVTVAIDLGSVDTSRISVSGGGSVPNASGTVLIAVTTLPNAPPGTTSFTVRGTGAGQAQQSTVSVTILGDFQLTGPATVNVLRAGSATAAIGVTPLQGFNAPVSLSYSSSNPGVTVNGPSSLAPGQQGQLIVSASADAPVGSAAVSIQGVSGSVSRSLSMNVQVGAFALSSIASQPLRLLLGGSASLPVTVTAEAGFSGEVQLSATATNGVTVNTVAPVVGSGSRTFTLGTTPAAVAGTAAVTITGTSENFSRSLEISVLLATPFTLSTTATQPLPVPIGGTAPLVVTVTAEPDFTGAVQLTGAATGGIQVSTVTPITGSGPRTFTLTTPGTAIAGPEKVTVSGTSTGFATTLEVPILLKESFTLTADPAIFFLGNPSQLVVRIQREQGFAGSVTVRLGTLPSSISGVNPASLVATSGVSTLTFSIIASGDPDLSGQTVSIPITGTVAEASPLELDRSVSPGGANIVTATATGTLLAPFSMSAAGPTALGPIQVGQTATASVAVTFQGSPAFAGPVLVTASAAGLNNLTGPVALSGSGTASFTFAALSGGAFPITVTARAGSFQLSTGFGLSVQAPPPPPPPPPPPTTPFSLSVTPASPNQVNANVPEVLSVKVNPLVTGFNQPVTITVTDGSQMKFDSLCGSPPGFVSYINGVLTFIIQLPYPAASFCMSAGQGVASTITDGPDSISITGVAGTHPPVVVPYSFQIGVPELVVSPVTTFNIPAGGSVQARIALNAAGGFNLPVHVHLTGPGSFISTGGPFQEPLPPGIASTDCGPEPTSQGKDVSPGGTITCTIANNTTSGSTTPIELEAFGTFGPGAKVVAFFNVCALGTAAPTGCTPAVLREDSQFVPARSKSEGTNAVSAQLNLSQSDIQFSPLMPKEGEQVRIQARVENNTSDDAEGVEVSLVINRQTVAMATVDIAAGKSQIVEFEWEAVFNPRLSAAISLDPQGSVFLRKVVAIPHFFVAPSAGSLPRQGRSLLVVRNGECGAFRFLNGAQSFCGGSSDLELMPTITGEGQLRMQIWTLNGGVVDLGPQPITGAVDVPETGYQATALLEGGHLYAVNSQGKYALLYVARVHSDVDPRLAKLAAGSGENPGLQSLGDLSPDQLNTLLDGAQITVDVQWAYQEDGSRRLQYGFAGGSGRIPAPTVFRQPRVPEGGAAQQ